MLLDLVDDLLNLARIAAGRLTVSADAFSANELPGALRAMMKPLVTSDAVSLIVEPLRRDLRRMLGRVR